MDFVASYSFGKDSALALHRMLQQGHRCVALLTATDPANTRSWVHGLQPALMRAVAQALRLPLLECPCTADDYDAGLQAGLARAKALGAQGCVFGDIDMPAHREWDEARCATAGLACLLPLWGDDRLTLVHECIDAGYLAAVKTVDKQFLDEGFLGQTLTRPLVAKIAATGADACGENGEYHTLVYGGPLFHHPVAWNSHGIVDLGRCLAADIRLAE